MSTGTKATPCRILLASKDPILRETRKLLISSFGYHVAAPPEQAEIKALIKSEHFDLLILGNTLDQRTIIELATEYRKRQPDGRIIEITSIPDDPPHGSPDATIHGLDGPLALRRAIEEQLPGAQG